MMVPESRRTANAQLGAILDPSSGKDTMYLSAGSRLPSAIPKGVQVIERENGIYLTTNREKAKAIRRAKPDELERMNGGLLYNKPSAKKGDGRVVVARDADGVPVTEIATTEDTIASDLLTALRQKPKGGAVEVAPIFKVLLERANLYNQE